VKIVVLVRRRREGPELGASAEGGMILGRCDAAALGAALRLRPTRNGSHVVAIACGPGDREDPALKWALASGADRAVRVSDPALEAVDYHGIARVLAAVTKKVGYDLVLAGDRTEDEAQGAVGPAVAEMLGIGHVTAALDVDGDAEGLRVTRRDSGLLRTLRVPLPSLVAVARLGSLRPSGETKGAPRGEIETMELAALGIQAPELRHRDRCIGRAHPVRVARNATMVKGARELVARLLEERLLD
jgi:electron transfer flavoprotein beta subunit